MFCTILMSLQGAGNSIFTLMHHNENSELIVHATDYSAKAIEVVKVKLTPQLVICSH